MENFKVCEDMHDVHVSTTTINMSKSNDRYTLFHKGAFFFASRKWNVVLLCWCKYSLIMSWAVTSCPRVQLSVEINCNELLIPHYATITSLFNGAAMTHKLQGYAWLDDVFFYKLQEHTLTPRSFTLLCNYVTVWAEDADSFTDVCQCWY